MASIAIIGAGYVGLVTAACLAELGHHVTCVEIDRQRLAVLQRGGCPIHEPGLPELLLCNRAQGRLHVTDRYALAIPTAEFVFLAVPTPSTPSGDADASYVFAATRMALDYVRPGAVIVTKSTVPVGTGDALATLVGSRGIRGVDVASNPEFLREGSAVHDFLHPDRIVIGAERADVHDRLARLYAALDAPVIRCDRRSAELGKYAANAMLAARISFMNEVARVCEATRADVQEIARIVGEDRRIGPAFLQAGIGWGGSCFPKDVRALAATAEAFGCETPILEAVTAINARQRARAFELLCDAASGQPSPVVAVLGLAFKPNTDDIRESPALDVIARLLEEDVHVRAHDPVAMANARAHLPQVQYCNDPFEIARDADALFLATEWPEYATLDWHRIGALMRGRVVLDGRNVLDRDLLAAAGLAHVAFGRSATPLAPPALAPATAGVGLVGGQRRA